MSSGPDTPFGLLASTNPSLWKTRHKSVTTTKLVFSSKLATYMQILPVTQKSVQVLFFQIAECLIRQTVKPPICLMAGACGYKRPPDPSSRQATLDMVFKATAMLAGSRNLLPTLRLNGPDVWTLREPLGLTIATLLSHSSWQVDISSSAGVGWELTCEAIREEPMRALKRIQLWPFTKWNRRHQSSCSFKPWRSGRGRDGDRRFTGHY